MRIQQQLWTVEKQPSQVAQANLADEKVLEDMLVAAPDMLSDQWMLIGRPLWNCPTEHRIRDRFSRWIPAHQGNDGIHTGH